MDKEDSLFQLQFLPKKTFAVTARVPFLVIKEAEKQIIEEEGKKIELKGFRKGMAPQNLVKEEVGEKRIFELVLGKILPDYYRKAIGQFNLKPIVSPKVELVSAKEEEDWQIKFTSCEEPDVPLGNYKEKIKQEAGFPAQIWTPGAKKEAKEDEKKINSILDWLIKNIRVEISDLLIEEETDRKLASLLEQIQKLGLTIDKYMTSIGKNAEVLRLEYAKHAQEGLALEFVLGRIADEEKIFVSDEDLNKAVSAAKNEEEKRALESQKYYLATLLRRQKTLDFLANL